MPINIDKLRKSLYRSWKLGSTKKTVKTQTHMYNSLFYISPYKKNSRYSHNWQTHSGSTASSERQFDIHSSQHLIQGNY